VFFKEDLMDQLMVTPGALPAASTAAAVTAATAGAMAVAESVPMTAVAPGTVSPQMVAATARIIEHGANRLAAAELGASVVAAVSAAFADSGLGYDVVEAASAAKLV
jgi:hypothetical protein